MNRPSYIAPSIEWTESLRVAIESLAANKLRSLLTMLGVIIGVTSVILLVSLGQGAQEYVDRQFSGIGTNLLFVAPGKTETKGMGPPLANVHKLTLGDADAIRLRCPSVDGVVPTILGGTQVKWKSYERNTMVLGVNDDWPRVFTLRTDQGRFFNADDAAAGRRVVILGPTVKHALFQEEQAIGKFVKLSGARYRIIGTMEKKGTMLGFDIDDIVYIPTRSAQKLFNVDRLFQIRARARSAQLVPQAIREITEVLKRRHNGNEDFNIVTQASMLSTFGNIMGILTAMLGGIAGISLLVGGIGIMNIMLVSVTERTREIGIRMAVGARRSDLLVQFLIESATLSSLGGALGVFLGVGISLLVRSLTPLPAHSSVWSIALAFFLSMAVGIFFGVWPAQKAAQLDPIEALRYE